MHVLRPCHSIECLDLTRSRLGLTSWRSCVWHRAAVYPGVTTIVAIAEPSDFAYERAFEAHWTDVFRFALAWTNEWTAAEDLAQDAYVRLWNHRDRLDWSRPVLPWLLT